MLRTHLQVNIVTAIHKITTDSWDTELKLYFAWSQLINAYAEMYFVQ